MSRLFHKRFQGSEKTNKRSILTCVTHVVVEGRVREMRTAASFVSRLGIVAAFVLGRGVGVGAQIARLHGRLRLQASVVARLDLRDPSKDVVEAQTVTDLVNHGVGVAECAVEGRVQHNPTWERERIKKTKKRAQEKLFKPKCVYVFISQ